MQRHIISTKLQGFSQTPQDIMEEYNGCSVPQYTRYPRTCIHPQGEPMCTSNIDYWTNRICYYKPLLLDTKSKEGL